MSTNVSMPEALPVSALYDGIVTNNLGDWKKDVCFYRGGNSVTFEVTVDRPFRLVSVKTAYYNGESIGICNPRYFNINGTYSGDSGGRTSPWTEIPMVYSLTESNNYEFPLLDTTFTLTLKVPDYTMWCTSEIQIMGVYE